MADRGIAVALLAAGMGRRFGGDKLDQDLGGRPVGWWAANAAETAGFGHRIIVTPPTPPSFLDQLAAWERVVNSDFHTGIASSIRAAAIAAHGYKRLVIILADTPLVEADHLKRLADGNHVAFTLYPDRHRGVPAGFPAEVFGTLASMPNDHSPATLTWSVAVDVFAPRLAVSLMDIDTHADLAVARSIIRTGNSSMSGQCPTNAPPNNAS